MVSAKNWIGCLLLGMLVSPLAGFDLRLESTGVRGAFSNPFNHARFYHTEAFINWDTPWHWELGRGWHLQTRLELTGGWMNGRGEDAAFGTIGPGFVASWKDLPIVLEAGISPTVLGREQFGNTDFGTVFQFTTHGGLTWNVTRRMGVGLRFLHISNADIGPSNPGVNLYSVGLGWRF
ncbi:MAG: acyloxyacyl hydrolase [Verrucomicrobia bacterium]|nr:acyloxyacyl hydrolase [Verrucomicrobiota bacterium]